MSSITGNMLLGAQAVRGQAGEMRAFAPALGKDIEPSFGLGGKAEVARACELAAQAFDAFRAAPHETRAKLLEAIAERILAIGDELIERAHLESALPKARLEGERGRTVGQLRLFASLVRDGRWCGAVLDSALPERKPLPRSDLRAQRIGLGPVAVFGASNFPLAFSVAGGDTASALAAGCPVVVKAHLAHPGTSELVGRAIQQAVADAGLPEGVFSLIFGGGNETGEALVAHPAIKSVGFTGSRRGGLALVDIASKRREPIPVFAEMSSINPFFVLPGALAKRAEALANGFVESVTLGVGQFCTNPGLVLVLEGPHTRTFIDAAAQALAKKGAQTMLTAGISTAYQNGVTQRGEQAGVQTIAQGAQTDAACPALPVLFETTAVHFLATPQLEDEIFGPLLPILTYSDLGELIAKIKTLPKPLATYVFSRSTNLQAS